MRYFEKLTNLCNIRYGYAFESKLFSENPNNIALIRIRDVKTGKSETYYSGDYDPIYLVNNGDILIGMDGEFNIAKWKSEPALLNQRVCKIIPNKNIDGDYLLFNLSLKLKEIEQETAFVTVKHLSAKTLNEISLNMHQLEDQRIISKQITILQDIITKKNKQLSEYDQLIKSRFVEMFGDPILNQKGWKSEKLQNVCPVNKYKGEVENTNGKVWLLNLDMVESNIGKIIDYVYEDENNVPSSTIKFDTNCVLYSKLRPYLNKVVIPVKSGYATSEMISMKTDNVSKYFLSNLLMMNSFVDFANGTSYGAKMPRASVDMIKNFDLMLPPKKLQEDFGLFVEQVDKLKLIVQEQINQLQNLFDSQMQKYFS